LFFYEKFITLLWHGEKRNAPFGHSLVAGGLAGASEACIITPLECVKIAMQSEKATAGSSHTGMLAFGMSMIRAGGIGSIYSGLAATVSKHTAHSCCYFAAYHETKKYLAPIGGQGTTKAQQVSKDLVAGFIAGCAAATANNPFDVVKTRQQVGAASVVAHHAAAQEFSQSSRSLFGWAALLMRTEGPAAFYKGYVAKVARLGPGSAIIFSVYEQVMTLF